uniref:MC28 n=1 Tax=Micrococcus sp. 28 TaxID=161213 RepID=Q8VPP5_9MICC|nr:MC28 [Micrococcus sp. 28]
MGVESLNDLIFDRIVRTPAVHDYAGIHCLLRRLVDSGVVVVHEQAGWVAELLEVLGTLGRLGPSPSIHQHDAKRSSTRLLSGDPLGVPVAKQAAQKTHLGRTLPDKYATTKESIWGATESALHVVEVSWNRPAGGFASLVGTHHDDIDGAQRLHRYRRVSGHDDLQVTPFSSLFEVVEDLRQPVRLEPVLDFVDGDDRAVVHRLILDRQARQPARAEPEARQRHVTVMKHQRMGGGGRTWLETGPQLIEFPCTEVPGRPLNFGSCIV